MSTISQYQIYVCASSTELESGGDQTSMAQRLVARKTSSLDYKNKPILRAKTCSLDVSANLPITREAKLHDVSISDKQHTQCSAVLAVPPPSIVYAKLGKVLIFSFHSHAEGR